MPLVRIDVNEGRTSEELQKLSRGIHEAIVAEYGIPERDYFHILTEHPEGRIVAQDAGLGFERTGGVMMIQIHPGRQIAGGQAAPLRGRGRKACRDRGRRRGRLHWVCGKRRGRLVFRVWPGAVCHR